MKYLLDTNTCINFLRLGSRSQVATKLAAMDPADVVLCSIVKSELIYGAWRSSQVAANLAKLERFFFGFVSLPLDDEAGAIAAHLRSELALKRLTIGPDDLLIASIAVAHGLILVTHDTAELQRIGDLRIEDWQ